MKEYWSIPGWKGVDRDLPCTGFEKPDGSNIRAEWSKKSGWYKFGSRTVLLDEGHPDLGEAIPLFKRLLAEPLEKVFSEMRRKVQFDSAVAYFEFFGPSSFAGQHMPGEPKELRLFDVNLHKRGFIVPREFIRLFGHLPTPKVLYEGPFDSTFIQSVRDGAYGQNEGVVVKGVRPDAKKEQHGLWMSKVKTRWWLEELGRRAENNVSLRRVYEDNMREQETS